MGRGKYRAWFIILRGKGAFRPAGSTQQAFVFAANKRDARRAALDRFPELAGKPFFVTDFG